MDARSEQQSLRQETRKRVFLAGATGYIGQHVARELAARGHQVICFARARSGTGGAADPEQVRRQLAGCDVRFGDVTNKESLLNDGLRGERFDVMVSCLASRSGGLQDSWRIDYEASRQLLEAGQAAGISHFVLLSAICVQKPRLAFQHAKLHMEQALINSGVRYSIVRPTAFFKSLSGQVEAVKKGRPYIMFGDGQTSCTPISEADLATFMADCLENPERHNRILPIGGPGKPLTARARGELLFELTGQKPRYRRIPVSLFKVLIPILDGLARLSPRFREKAEFARIAHYYATESMLVLDPHSGRYDAAATPVYGKQTLREFYWQALTDGLSGQELGDHRLFAKADKVRAP